MTKTSNTTDRRTMLKTVAIGAGMAVVAGCTGGTNGSGSVTVGTPHWGLWDPSIVLMVGQEENLFEDAELEIERVDMSGGGENVRTVAAGDADVGLATGMLSLFGSYREGTNIQIVGNQISHSDAIWYTTSDSEYEDVEDLDGAKVAYSAEGSSTHIVVEEAINYASLSDLNGVSTGGPPDTHAELKGGSIDVAWTVPPFFIDTIESGENKIVFEGNNIPPFDDITMRGMIANSDWLSNSQDDAEVFFDTYVEALDVAYNNINETVELWASFHDDVNVETLRGLVDDMYPRDALDPHDFVGLDSTNKIAVEQGFIESELDDDEIDDLIDTSILP